MKGLHTPRVYVLVGGRKTPTSKYKYESLRCSNSVQEMPMCACSAQGPMLGSPRKEQAHREFVVKLVPPSKDQGEDHSRERGRLLRKLCRGDDLGMFQEESERGQR